MTSKKNILFILCFVIMLFVTVNSAVGELTPFDQCGKVTHFANGSTNSNLNCFLDNGSTDFPMAFDSSIGGYCAEVNGSVFSIGTHDWTFKCNDGSENKSVLATLIIDDPDAVNTPKSAGSGVKKIEVVELKCGEGLSLLNDTCVDLAKDEKFDFAGFLKKIAGFFKIPEDKSESVFFYSLIGVLLCLFLMFIWYVFKPKKKKGGDVIMAKETGLDMLARWLLIVGGLNWGLVGLFQFDLVQFLLGGFPMLARAVYVAIGVGATMKLWKMFRK